MHALTCRVVWSGQNGARGRSEEAPWLPCLARPGAAACGREHQVGQLARMIQCKGAVRGAACIVPVGVHRSRCCTLCSPALFGQLHCVTVSQLFAAPVPGHARRSIRVLQRCVFA